MTGYGSNPRLRTLRATIGDVWRLARPFFASDQKRMAWTLLLSVLVLNLASVGIDVAINFWYGAFYDSLQNKDVSSFVNLLLVYRDIDGFPMPGFIWLAMVAIGMGVLSLFLQQSLEIRWRRWLTMRVLQQYTANRVYYRISLATDADAIGTDNPDQRIAEDVRDFVRSTLSLSLDFISNAVSLFSFMTILWRLSGSVTLFGITIPGYLVLFAVAYAASGTVLTHLVGRPLAALRFVQQRREADFRFALVRFRENTESIALSGGEPEERGVLQHRFGGIVDNFYQLLRRVLFLNAFTSSYQQLAVIFPFVIAAPRYFAGAIELGGLMRIVSGFGQVQKALSWFVTSYPDLALLRANVDRLSRFETAIRIATEASGNGARLRPATGPDLSTDDLTVTVPDGRVLLSHAALRFVPGQAVVVSGRSGSGKSSLFRTLAGIWPHSSGTVERPAGSYLFLPQRPYIPLGTLRHAVCYPADRGQFAAGLVEDALDAAGLGALVPELDTEDVGGGGWGQRLSGGEQQRLAVARALLLKPDWLFLDEATANLDPQAEASLYGLLRSRLPRSAILSIAHRPAVAGHHDRRLVLSDGSLQPAPDAPAPDTTASTAGP